MKLTAETMLTWPAAGGGMRDCGSGGMAPPHSLQKRANGSVGRGAKQLVHLQQFANPTAISLFVCRLHNNNFLSMLCCLHSTVTWELKISWHFNQQEPFVKFTTSFCTVDLFINKLKDEKISYVRDTCLLIYFSVSTHLLIWFDSQQTKILEDFTW